MEKIFKISMSLKIIIESIKKKNINLIAVDGISCSGKSVFSALIKKKIKDKFPNTLILSKDLFLFSRKKRIKITKTLKNKTKKQNILHYDLKKLSMKKCKGYWSSFMVHSSKKGTYKNLFISNKIKSQLIKSEMFVKSGDQVKKYSNSQHILGNLILKFKNQKEMLSLYEDPEKHIRINLF